MPLGPNRNSCRHVLVIVIISSSQPAITDKLKWELFFTITKIILLTRKASHLHSLIQGGMKNQYYHKCRKLNFEPFLSPLREENWARKTTENWASEWCVKVNEIYHQMTRSINQPWTTSSAKGNYSNFLKGLACSLYFHLLVRLLQVCTSKNHKGFNKCKHKGVESTCYHALPLGLLAHLLYYDIVYQTCQNVQTDSNFVPIVSYLLHTSHWVLLWAL